MSQEEEAATVLSPAILAAIDALNPTPVLRQTYISQCKDAICAGMDEASIIGRLGIEDKEIKTGTNDI